MSEPGPRIARAGDTVAITLDRPQRRNAIGAAEFDALEATLAELESDRSISLVTITGTGPVFSAGVDLALIEQARQVPGGHMRQVERGSALIARLEALPQLVIAGLNGPAVGLGVHVALAADFIIADRNAFLLLPEAPLGLPEVMLVRQLSARLGRHRALGMLLLGRRLPAEEAHAAGLIGPLVDGADAIGVAVDTLCADLRKIDAAIRAEAKKAAIAAGPGIDRNAQLAAVAAVFGAR